MLLDNHRLDKSVPIPLYFQLKELILSEIRNGNYESGSLIPTENELSDAFEISRTTVRQAITELVQDGWLYRIKSKGTFVSQPKISQDFIKKLESYNDQMLRLGMTPSTEVNELSVQKANEQVAKALHLSTKDKVIFLSRRRFVDGEPLVTIDTYLPYKKCSFLMDCDFTKVSLYQELAAQGDEFTVFQIQRLVEAVEATASDAKSLDMKKGKPVQHFSSIGCNAFGVPLEYSLARYRGDKSRFEVTVFPEQN